MSYRIGRVADDHPNIQFLLPGAAVAIVRHQIADEVAFLLVKLEGVRKADTLERHIIAAQQTMIRGFNVDGRNVVGQQHDFVGVNLVSIFVLKLVELDKAGLQQARDERSRPGEWVQDMNAPAAKGLAEFRFQRFVDRVNDEIHHLDRGIDDPKPLGHFRESVAEELVVKLDNDSLLALGVVDAGGPDFDIGIELLKAGGFLFQIVLVQCVQNALHCAGNRIFPGETVSLEQGFKDRSGDQVLRQHFDSFVFADAVVQIVAKFGKEFLESFPFVAAGLFHQSLDAGDMGLGDLADIGRPIFPIRAASAFLDDPSQYRL